MLWYGRSLIQGEKSVAQYLRKMTDLEQLENVPVYQSNFISLDDAGLPIHLDYASEELHLREPCGTVVGRLNPRYSKLIRVLRDGESIELQTNLVPPPSQKPNPRHSRNRPPTLSIIIYGAMDMLESIGGFLLQCSEYLQPPISCDRNVPYCNPQNLAGRDEVPKMTFQLQVDVSSSSVEAVVHGADPSATLETEDLNSEMEAPAVVKSTLYRYIYS